MSEIQLTDKQYDKLLELLANEEATIKTEYSYGFNTIEFSYKHFSVLGVHTLYFGSNSYTINVHDREVLKPEGRNVEKDMRNICPKNSKVKDNEVKTLIEKELGEE